MKVHRSARIAVFTLVMGFAVGRVANAGPYELEPHVHAHGEYEIVEVSGTTEISIHEAAGSQVLLPVVSAAQTTRFPGSQWDFIGVGAGANYWRLPKDQNISVLFLGLSTEELTASDFASPITFTLLGVTGTSGSPAPGFFSAWNTGDLGPVPLMSTAVGTTPNSLSVAAGSHSHFNYGFTAPGLYNVEFKVSGTLAPSLGGELVEGTTTYSFGVFDQNNYPEVASTPYVFEGQSFPYFMYGNAHADLGVALVPEPSSIVLAGLGCLGVAAVALRRSQRRSAGKNGAETMISGGC